MARKAKGKHRLDKFYHLAKEQGYRSRAAFKLIQLNRKYDFLGKSRACLDLCAAPGGWAQVAVKSMPVGSLIVAIDLVAMKPIRGVTAITGDITTQQARSSIKTASKGSMFDLVIHDGAPNVGGAWASEAYAQCALVLESLKLASEVLTRGGVFVTKVFRSSEYTHLLYAFNQLFTSVHVTKPTASRQTSAEIFVVCLGYKAPAKIDARLLDSKTVFQNVHEHKPAEAPAVLLGSKGGSQRRQRAGYADGISLTHAVQYLVTFVLHKQAVQLLGNCTQIKTEPAQQEGIKMEGVSAGRMACCLHLLNQIRDTIDGPNGVGVLCQDIQVLGKKDFKQLLKWRAQVRKQLDQLMASDEGKQIIQRKIQELQENGEIVDAEDDEGSDKDKKSGDEESEEEMDGEERIKQALIDQEMAKKKLEKLRLKKQREGRRKLKIRSAQATQQVGIDEGQAEGLFSLKSVQGTQSGAHVATLDAGVEYVSSSEDEGGDGLGGLGQYSLDSDDSEEEVRRKQDEAMEEMIDSQYNSYVGRQAARDANAQSKEAEKVRKKRRRLGMSTELDELDQDQADAQQSSGHDLSTFDQGGGGLIADLDQQRKKRSQPEYVAQKWFEQSEFGGVGQSDSDEEDDDGDVDLAAEKVLAARGARGAKTVRFTDQGEDDEGQSDGDVYIGPGKEGGPQRRGGGVEADGSGGEIEFVPKEKGVKGGEGGGGDDEDDLSSDGEFELMPMDTKAEILALAKRMLKNKDKQSIIEAAYNRYAFHDDDLPQWFVDDEQKHMRPQQQVTKAEVDEARQALRELNARPVKKVMEAKMRKRKRLLQRMTKARAAADAISGQEDVPLAQKLREIERLYAKATSEGGGKKGKNGKKGKQKKKVKLDNRMRADERTRGQGRHGAKKRQLMKQQGGKNNKQGMKGKKKGAGRGR